MQSLEQAERRVKGRSPVMNEEKYLLMCRVGGGPRERVRRSKPSKCRFLQSRMPRRRQSRLKRAEQLEMSVRQWGYVENTGLTTSLVLTLVEKESAQEQSPIIFQSPGTILPSLFSGCGLHAFSRANEPPCPRLQTAFNGNKTIYYTLLSHHHDDSTAASYLILLFYCR